MSIELKFPTEKVALPSKGLLYPKTSPLSSGTVEMKYMTAKEEDILTNINYLQQGTIIDKLLESLIVDKTISLDEMLQGDKDALIIAARILGYGKDYDIEYNKKSYTIDLSALKERKVDESLFANGVNKFSFTLPISGVTLEFKLLNGADEKAIDKELEGYQKIDSTSLPENTTRLKQQIISVNGDKDRGIISNFVDNLFLVKDARAFRKYVASIEPAIDLTFYPQDGPEGGVKIPMGMSFFWPDSGV